MLVEPLSTFWRATAERLAEGVSAQELTRELNLSLADTRFYLHKLRAAGYIVPVRAFQVEPAREERISIASRLLCALFGRGR
jgi:hypothetical protein